jgi:hypothetical protein
MKTFAPQIGLGTMCQWFDVSRQAYYQHEKCDVIARNTLPFAG